MLVEVRIPEVGESIVEVQITEWLKAEGDLVKKDEPLAVIDSEKTTFDLPAPESGKLSRILCPAGQTTKVGAIIAQIESGPVADPVQAPSTRAPAQPKPEAVPLAQPAKESQATPSAPEPARAPTPAHVPPPRRSKPATRSPARAATLTAEAPAEGTTSPAIPSRQAPPASEAVAAKAGPEAPPLRDDGAGREEEIVPMSMLRRTVARRLVEAQRTMAMLTTFNEVDMSAVQALRQQRQEAFQKRYQVKLGLISFFVKAAIAALKEFPQLNAEVRGDDIVYRNYFDIGVAIATPQGLVVPVLLNAARLSFAEIESAVADFARRAKERRLKPQELEGGTFTITNGGVFGSLLSTPILNPPQSGILGLHAITERPVARAGQVVIRPMMYVALTYDHRIVDGREAVLFLRRIKEVIEEPARMLIEV